MSRPAISMHLKVLEVAGLVSRRRRARHNLRRLGAARPGGVAEWLGTYREFWKGRFARLDEHVVELEQVRRPA